MSAIRRIPAFIGLSRWSYRVLVSYPRERLFVFGHTRLLRSRQPFGGMGEQPFLNRDYHTTAEFFFSPTNSQPCIAYHAYLLPVSPNRRRIAFARCCHLAFAYNGRHHGCDGWDSNPRFPAYEAGDLATSLPRNINYFFLTFCKYYIIIFTKVQNLKRKDFGSLWVYQPWSE